MFRVTPTSVSKSTMSRKAGRKLSITVGYFIMDEKLISLIIVL